MQKLALTLTRGLVIGLASCGSPEPESIVSQNLPFLSSPPSIEASGKINDWSYAFSYEDADVSFSHRRDTSKSQTLTTPDAGVLGVYPTHVGGTDYFVVGTVNASDEFTLYRYRDAGNDGVPDAWTKVALLSSAPKKMYVTSIAFIPKGEMYLFDARRRDVHYARDTDSDGWPDSIATTPFARSDDFDEFEHIQAIRAVERGEVLGLLSYASSDGILSTAIMAGYIFEDTNDDDVADIVSMPRFESGYLRTKGQPYDGQSSIEVRGPEGTTAQVWLLDTNDDETSLLASGAVAAERGWTTLSLSNALAEDDRISIRRSDDPAGATLLSVMDSRPQIVGTEPSIAEVTGATFTLEGLNFEMGMSAELIAADGSEYPLTVTYVSSTEATVTVAAMTDDQSGTATISLRKSTTPLTDAPEASATITFLPEPDSQ